MHSKALLNKVLFAACFIASSTAWSGVIVNSNQDQHSVATIYQDGIAVYLINNQAHYIIDTKDNSCITINHQLKRYIFLQCSQFGNLKKAIEAKEYQHLSEKTPYAVREMMSTNQAPRTKILTKRAGRATYAGYNINKFQLIVDEEIVAEYWVSAELKKRVAREINLKHLNLIIDTNYEYHDFKLGLNVALLRELRLLRAKGFVLRKIRYTGSKTIKTNMKVVIKKMNLKQYFPPFDYKINYTIAEYMKF